MNYHDPDSVFSDGIEIEQRHSDSGNGNESPDVNVTSSEVQRNRKWNDHVNLHAGWKHKHAGRAEVSNENRNSYVYD